MRPFSCFSTLLLLCLLAGCERPQPSALGTTERAPVRAPAPQPFGAPGSDGWGTVDGLAYQEFVVGGGRADQALPMLVLLHGMGDQPGDHWFRVIHVSDPLRVIMPRAPKPYGSGFSWFDYRVGDNDPVALGRGIAAEADHLARALPQLIAGRPTRGLPIVAGFSQGGMLSFALGVRHPEQLALALPISGTLPPPIWPTARNAAGRQVPIRALHGTADTVVPIDTTAQLVTQLEQLGYDITLQRFEGVGHSITPEMQGVIAQQLHEVAAEAPAP